MNHPAKIDDTSRDICSGKKKFRPDKHRVEMKRSSLVKVSPCIT